MVDKMIEEMVSIIRYTHDQNRAQIAVKTLLGLIPSFTNSDYSFVVEEMQHLIKHSNDPWRCDVASNVLILVRNAQG